MSELADPDHRVAPTDAGAVGILLAAGAGRRMGRPKALVVGEDGMPWLERGVRVLQAGGCAHVVVVLGADAADARELLGAVPGTVFGTVRIVEAPDWHDGLGASLRAGLAAVTSASASAAATCAVITLVDLPELRPESVRRLAAGATETTLRQASYAGVPGHPVVIGAAHFAPLAAGLEGDVGARPYLLARGVEDIDCTDLGGGDDVDSPPLRAR